MGSCLSAPSDNNGSADSRRDNTAASSGGPTTQGGADSLAPTGGAAAAESGRISGRRNRRNNSGGSNSGSGTRRERSSLELRNAEARDALLAGRGAAPTFRRHGAWEARPAVTRAQLEHTRTAFWETADTFGGRRETWDVLRRCVEIAHELASADGDASAQALIESADIRLLGNGDLVNGCYDATGFYYKIPEACLSDPSNLLPDDEYDLTSSKIEDDRLASPNVTEGSLTSSAGGAATTNDTKLLSSTPTPAPGQPPVLTPAAIGDETDVRVRMSHTSRDLVLRVSPSRERVAALAAKVRRDAGIGGCKLMLLGRLIKDDHPTLTLEASGWRPGLVIQALVTKP
ncbi:hypothetical protein PYCC9005_004690 [Savitreella phatthalungensis]